MKKINTIHFPNSQSFDILTASQMSSIRGGLDAVLSTVDTLYVDPTLSAVTAATVGPISATLDDKRRDRPGGGISTH